MGAIHGTSKHNSNIKDHYHHNKRNNDGKLWTFWGLPKCDTETQNKQMLLETVVPTDLFNVRLPQTFNLYKAQ